MLKIILKTKIESIVTLYSCVSRLSTNLAHEFVEHVRFTTTTQDRYVVDLKHIKIHTRLMCHVKSYHRIQDPAVESNSD